MLNSEILISAQRRISDLENWTQGAFSRDAKNAPIHTDDQTPVKWCAAGALGETKGCWMHAYEYLFDAASKLYGGTIAQVNDNQGHGAVMYIYDVAINQALKDEYEDS